MRSVLGKPHLRSIRIKHCTAREGAWYSPSLSKVLVESGVRRPLSIDTMRCGGKWCSSCIGDSGFGTFALRLECTLSPSESSEAFAESAVNPTESELRLPTELGRYVCDVDAVDRGVGRSEGEDADAVRFIPCVPHMGTCVCEDAGLSCPLCRGCCCCSRLGVGVFQETCEGPARGDSGMPLCRERCEAV